VDGVHRWGDEGGGGGGAGETHKKEPLRNERA